MDYTLRHPRNNVGNGLKLLVISFLLALLAFVCGCSQMPSGLNFSVGLTGDPPGVVFSLKTPITVIASDGFTVGPPTTHPALIPAPPDTGVIVIPAGTPGDGGPIAPQAPPLTIHP